MRYLLFFYIFFQLISCSNKEYINLKPSLSDNLNLNNAKVIKDTDTLVCYYSPTIITQAGIIVTKAAIVDFWMDSISVELNKITRISFDSIIAIDTFYYNSKNDFAPFLIVKNNKLQIKKINVNGKKDMVEKFYIQAYNSWVTSEKYKSNLQLAIDLMPLKIFERNKENYYYSSDAITNEKTETDSIYIALDGLKNYTLTKEILEKLIKLYIKTDVDDKYMRRIIEDDFFKKNPDLVKQVIDETMKQYSLPEQNKNKNLKQLNDIFD